jgi:hypothetical protein
VGGTGDDGMSMTQEIRGGRGSSSAVAIGAAAAGQAYGNWASSKKT